LHLQHGPIDLIVVAEGDSKAVSLAYEQAHDTFEPVLTHLVEELDELRKPLSANSAKPSGPVARRMHHAAKSCMQLESLSPMIAVAGSVADHILQAMCRSTSLQRAYVNNGGDIALWLAPEQTFTIGICEKFETRSIGAEVTLYAQHAVGGVATSGWRGRSHSLGIADAVTVLAATAADADTAATLIANAVDVPGSMHIIRQPAFELSPDSDLGDRLVTVAVDSLSADDIAQALERGKIRAEQLLSSKRISAAYISLEGRTVVCGSATPITYRSDTCLK